MGLYTLLNSASLRQTVLACLLFTAQCTAVAISTSSNTTFSTSSTQLSSSASSSTQVSISSTISSNFSSGSVTSASSSVTTSSTAASNVTVSSNSTVVTVSSNNTTAANTTNSTSLSGITVSSTVLVFARDIASAYSGTSGLNAYGIPYQVVIVPQSGITLPTLNSSATVGLFGGIIVLSEVSYQYSTAFNSALTADQWQQLYAYQTAFGVRMVRIDVYPNTEFGTTTTIPSTGCCSTDVEQFISFSDTSDFPTANVKTGATMSTANMWHYPATITNSTIAKEIAQFAPSGTFTSTTTAAIINTFGSRQQMVWFTSWATSWSATSNFLQHAHIHWMTRGLYVGQRRLYYSSQVDDMQLATYLYPYPDGGRFRARPSDMDAHVAWQANLNARLPAGSSYTVEIGHNGNGNIEWAVNNDTNGICNPDNMIQYDAPPDTALEFQKVVGTGTDLWPTTPATYVWSLACTAIDSLGAWFEVPKNRDAFWHISHTFTHEDLDNATYSDTVKELTFNKAWLKQVGLDAGKFATNGLIPPAITGMHNGDAIKAMLDNGIKYVVGDSSRPPLLNTVNEHWPLISTVEGNGYAGLTILPRWATPIYYNCDTANCTLSEWINTSKGSGDFNALLKFSKDQFTRSLLGLRHDGFMFHQANMRHGDVASFTVGTQTDNMSLLQIFTEVMLQEIMRLTTWPIRSIAHDDLAVSFQNRMARDQCQPTLSWTLSDDGKTISKVTVGANSNSCSVPIPVTFPGTASTKSGSFYDEKLGSDPLTKWTTLSGSAVTYTLGSPVAI